ncbi:hypothetical protein PQX77_007701 [Marasmius sp. AFHP31]|nr:hypothetical protein PQX77_007701 [Marasmius sp. AFHP31]
MQPRLPAPATNWNVGAVFWAEIKTSSRDTEDMEDQHLQLASRIRGLSTAIWWSRFQGVACLPRPGTDGATLETNQNVAIMLSRDLSVEPPVVVTGGWKSSLVVAATHITCTPRLFPAPPAPSSMLQEVRPNSSSFGQLLLHESSSVPLTHHVADVLQVTRLLSTSTDIAHDLLSLYQFTLRRCWPEFKARVDASFDLLAYPPSANLLTVLRGWHIDAQQVQPGYSTRVHIGDTWLSDALQNYGFSTIPTTHPEETPCFHFGHESSETWFGFLCDVLEGLMNAAFSDHMEPNQESLLIIVKSLQILSPLLDSHPITTLFSLPSLHHHLRPYRKQNPAASQNWETNVDTRQLHIMYDERIVCETYHETEGNHVLRYISSLLTWFKAATGLFNHARRFGVPRIQIVDIIDDQVLPETNGRSLPMDNPHQVLETIKSEGLSTIPRIDSHRQTLDYAPLSVASADDSQSRYSRSLSLSREIDKGLFLGKTHTLALATSMLKGFLVSERRSVGASASSSSAGLFAFPSPHPATSKCCYCCSLLQDILHRPQRYQSDPQPDTAMLSALPGFLVPWTPPPFGFGVSLGTLRIIERRLHDILFAIVMTESRR